MEDYTMKLEITKKAIRDLDQTILKIGYCSAQYLLRFQPKFAYSAGKYGWSCDYYEVNGVIISTGYFPIGKEVEYKLVQEYDDKAREICNDHSRSYEDQKTAVNTLLYELIEKAMA